ncbi:MAG: radical SAM protein [Syntrophomonas sp.]
MGTTWNELCSNLAANAREKRIPLFLSFELTARCNQQCKMCYLCVPMNDQQAKNKEMPAEQWLRLAREAREAGLLMVSLTGGEVFLREDFKQIYEGIMELGLIVQILTNGTMITPQIVEWLKAIPPLKVSITLYGATKETCAKITGYPESYNRTVQAIDSLRAAGIPTEVKTTVVRANKYELDQLSEFVRKRGLMLGVVNYISPRREGLNSNPLANRLSPEELVEYEIQLQEHNKKLAMKAKESKISLSDSVSNTIPNKKRNNDPNDPFQCSAGKSSAWVTWDGRLIPCGLMNKPLAYPLKTGFLTAWEEIKHQCSLIPANKECLTCEYKSFCEQCPARLLNETEAYNKPAPYLCAAASKRYAYSR